jgi:hypothetical protein
VGRPARVPEGAAGCEVGQVEAGAYQGEGINNPLAANKTEFNAYYLGPKEFLPQVREWFRRELEGRDGLSPIRMKEVSYVDRAYGLSQWNGQIDDSGRTIGWWDIGNHWVLFKSKTDANKFRDALKEKK